MLSNTPPPKATGLESENIGGPTMDLG